MTCYIVALALGAGGIILLAVQADFRPELEGSFAELICLAVGLLLATRLRVSIRQGDGGVGLSLVEAVLLPIVVVYPTWVVGVVSVMVAATSSAFLRLPLIKASFNVASFTLASVAASFVVDLADLGGEPGPAMIVWLTLALLVTAIVNSVALMGVLSISQWRPFGSVVREAMPTVLPGTAAGWLVNVLIGLLFVLAERATPYAVLLFPVPLVLLHLAYRGYTAARTDRQRLAGLRDAAVALAEPLDPRDAVEAFLGELARSFECRAAGMVLAVGPDALEACVVDRSGQVQRYDTSASSGPAADVQAMPGITRLSRTSSALLLDRLGWRDATVVALEQEGERLGTLAIIDQAGVDQGSDLAVLDALARETAHTLARGRLLEQVTAERRKLDEVMRATSDGIYTVDADGRIRSWNSACERIMGLAADEVLGSDDVFERLHAYNDTVGALTSRGWQERDRWLPEMFVTRPDGTVRRLSCSFRRARDDDGTSSGREILVVVARDVTPADQYHDLQVQFQQLVRQSAAQRLVVEHLQSAVAPEPPAVEGAELAVRYVASDPASPTGGDLFDWYVLPNGLVHLAVVDVLGHGVTATKDALTVVHSLRYAAVDGTPLADLVERADALLSAEALELAATLVIARYDPATGRLWVASGGHPPALVVRGSGEAETIDVTGGAIGWPGVGSHEVAELTLETGDCLVLYTDGLIEGRRDVVEGLERVTQLASEMTELPASEMATTLVERSLADADRRDDTLALVLRRTGAVRRSWTVETGSNVAVSRARRNLAAWLGAHDMVSEDAPLVTSELLSNAVAAAHARVTLTAEIRDDGVLLEVRDDGTGSVGLDGMGIEPPSTEGDGGRGLYLVRQLSRDVEIVTTETGTTVRCTVPAERASSVSRR